MDNDLKALESRLKNLVPRGLSDHGRERCSSIIDQLAQGGLPNLIQEAQSNTSTLGVSWRIASAAAAVTLGLGIGGGWWLGKDAGLPASDPMVDSGTPTNSQYEVLNSQTWLSSVDSPRVYVAQDGQAREFFNEVAVTKDVVKYVQSGHVVTVETTESSLVDSVKDEF